MRRRAELAESVRLGVQKTVAAVLAVIGLASATSGELQTAAFGVLVLGVLAVIVVSHPEILED